MDHSMPNPSYNNIKISKYLDIPVVLYLPCGLIMANLLLSIRNKLLLEAWIFALEDTIIKNMIYSLQLINTKDCNITMPEKMINGI